MIPSNRHGRLARTLVAMGISVAMGAGVLVAAPHVTANESLKLSFANFGPGGHLRAGNTTWEVEKTSDRATYRPGEEATYTVTATPKIDGIRWYEHKAVAFVMNDSGSPQDFTVSMSVPGAPNCDTKQWRVAGRGYAHIQMRCAFEEGKNLVPFEEAGQISLSLGEQTVHTDFDASSWQWYDQVIARHAILGDPMRPGGDVYLRFPNDGKTPVVDSYKAVVGENLSDLDPGECRSVENTATLYEDIPQVTPRGNTVTGPAATPAPAGDGLPSAHGLRGDRITSATHTVQVCDPRQPARTEVVLDDAVTGELSRTHSWTLSNSVNPEEVILPGSADVTFTVTEGTPVDGEWKVKGRFVVRNHNREATITPRFIGENGACTATPATQLLAPEEEGRFDFLCSFTETPTIENFRVAIGSTGLSIDMPELDTYHVNAKHATVTFDSPHDDKKAVAITHTQPGKVHSFTMTKEFPVDALDDDRLGDVWSGEHLVIGAIASEDGLDITQQANVMLYKRGLELEVAANKDTGLKAGDTLTYTITLRNPSEVPVDMLTVHTDEFTGSGTFGDWECIRPEALMPGMEMTCTVTYVVTEDDARAGEINLKVHGEPEGAPIARGEVKVGTTAPVTTTPEETTESNQPTEPSQLVDPSTSMEPSQSTEPSRPSEMSKSAEPTPPADPSEPAPDSNGSSSSPLRWLLIIPLISLIAALVYHFVPKPDAPAPALDTETAKAPVKGVARI